jgi:hypothetical protein
MLTPLGMKVILLFVLILLTPFYIWWKNALKDWNNGEPIVIFVAIFMGPLLGGIGIYVFLVAIAPYIIFYLSKIFAP